MCNKALKAMLARFVILKRRAVKDKTDMIKSRNQEHRLNGYTNSSSSKHKHMRKHKRYCSSWRVLTISGRVPRYWNSCSVRRGV